MAALGLALIGYLLTHIGLRAVLTAAGSIGLGGFGLLCVLAFGVFAVLGPAWYMLLPRAMHPSLKVLIWARMVRDAASEALPFSQVGGMVLGVRAAGLSGMPTRLTVASMIVDVTTELIGQLLYVGFGLLLLVTRGAQSAAATTLERSILIGLAVMTICGIGFLAMQRRGLGWLSDKLAGRLFPASAAYMSGVAADLRAIHRSPLRLVVSACIHFCAWNAAALTTWVAFRLIGVHVDISAVIALESLVYAVRSLAFFVPNALGVQEAAYTVLAPLVGIGKEFALAVSLLRRARDIAVGIPILLVYQLLESRRALARRVHT
ncbi:MAG TPA: lysylphosphatidylglycerol synthase domain-containing protein [Steroidobacteraceae bacterium]|nr:lysylphosphatidylglycerol synthase domain-containing protein [Steroidobacteraceae bacterium]